MLHVISLVDMNDEEWIRVFPDKPIIEWEQINYLTSDWDIELMQFTWLHDKNGKEIYEWDILKFRTKENNFVKVYFDDGGFKMKLWNTISSLSYFLGKYQCEIIWNIYESPELLTK